MHRFFSSSRSIVGNEIIISDLGQVHHLQNVLRLKVGDKVVVFDESGNEYITVIEKLLSKSVRLKINQRRKFMPAKEKIKLTVACAIPKKSKFDDIVDKLTQLGVDRIIPLKTKRVVIKWDKQKEISQLKRWQRIALNASIQSQRNTLPVIESIKKIEEVLSESEDYDLRLIPTLTGRQKSLKEIFASFKPKHVLILIGPEGDFSPEELNLAKNKGFIPLSLGDLVLRVETACVAVASFMRLYDALSTK